MSKTLITEQGEVRISTPRDRAGTFEPQIVRKRQRRFEGFDDKILALYARGMSTRDISAHLEEIYGVEVGRDLISKVTDAVMEDARAWQTCHGCPEGNTKRRPPIRRAGRARRREAEQSLADLEL